MVHWLGLHAFTAEGLDSVPSLGTKIPQVMLCGKNKKKKKKTTTSQEMIELEYSI